MHGNRLLKIDNTFYCVMCGFGENNRDKVLNHMCFAHDLSEKKRFGLHKLLSSYARPSLLEALNVNITNEIECLARDGENFDVRDIY